MRELSQGYTAEIDSVDENTWYQIIEKFDDANIYQTWSYDAIRCGRKNISHLILRKNDMIVSACQARIIKIPVFNLGIAYIRWGPLWRLCNTELSLEIFRQTIRALRNEYVYNRGLALRLRPTLFNDDSDSFLKILIEERYQRYDERKRTLIINLNSSIEDLRKGLHQKWRNHLNHAEKNQLEISEGNNEELFIKFIEIYKNLIERKKFSVSNDILEFQKIQKDLPKRFKPKVILCRSNGNYCAGIICSAIGKTGVTLFRAINEIGLKNNAAYLVQWRVLEWLKQMNCTRYDLNGINPDKNPGTYKYKTGFCGRNGKDVYFLGYFDSYKNSLVSSGIKFAEVLRFIYSKFKNFIFFSLK